MKTSIYDPFYEAPLKKLHMRHICIYCTQLVKLVSVLHLLRSKILKDNQQVPHNSIYRGKQKTQDQIIYDS